MDDIHIERLDDSTDARGLSFSILEPLLSKIGHARDVHIGEILPGCIRGNHFHARRGELIAVVFSDTWSLHWDTGPDTAVHVRRFDGSGAIAVIPPRNWSHAVKNEGVKPMWIFAVSDQRYDRHESDSTRRDVVRREVAS